MIPSESFTIYDHRDAEKIEKALAILNSTGGPTKNIGDLAVAMAKMVVARKVEIDAWNNPQIVYAQPHGKPEPQGKPSSDIRSEIERPVRNVEAMKISR